MMKRIAVLTSGGDAPGMNAAIRSVTRTAISKGMTVYGIEHGYAGLLAGEMRLLGPRDVGGIIHQGGTFLGSARSEEFKTEAGQRKALRQLNQMEIEGLVVIGGNGSQTGANALHKLGLPVVGVASTIDNDLYGSDITIGADTAMNIALEAIDRLKTTASSHQRAFLIEVMGRDCGYIALMAGIAGGAEAVSIPEREIQPEKLADTLLEAYERGKTHGIIVVAEGARYDADALAAYFKEHQETIGFELRTSKLGHIQRGGIPTLADRILGSRLGAGAVEELARGNSGVLVGMQCNQLATTPLVEIAGKHRPVDPALLELADILAR
ncbi:MAG: 6-phosphofructokinase [Anaerolineae bacterium]